MEKGNRKGSGGGERERLFILLPSRKEQRAEKLRVLEWYLGAAGAIRRRQLTRSCDGGGLTAAHARGRQDPATGRSSLRHVAAITGAEKRTGGVGGGQKTRGEVSWLVN